MISKELLSEVMGYPLSRNINECGITRVIGLNESDSDGSLDLDFGYQGLESSHSRYINVYQLSHKCKEWALLNGFEIYSKKTKYKGVAKIKKYINGSKRKNLICCKIANTEIKAIFDICQWILDNKDNK